MKTNLIVTLLCCLFAAGATAGPTKTAEGLYKYSFTVTDEAGEPLEDVSIDFHFSIGEIIGSCTNYQGTVTMLSPTLMTEKENNAVRIHKKGYLPETIFFDEESDGVAKIVLKTDPNAPQKKSKKRNRR